MRKSKIVLPNEVEQAFRKATMMRFGYQTEAISEAAGEAIKKWSNSIEKEEKKEVSWNKFVGILKHVKKTSVELQHESWDYIAKKHVNRQ